MEIKAFQDKVMPKLPKKSPISRPLAENTISDMATNTQPLQPTTVNTNQMPTKPAS